MTKSAAISYNPATHVCVGEGEWNINHITAIKNQIKNIQFDNTRLITINGKSITKMDVAGAWLLIEWQQQLSTSGIELNFQAFSQQHQNLLELVGRNLKKETKLKEKKNPVWLARFGKQSITMANEFVLYLNFIGQLTMEAARLFVHPKRMRWQALFGIIYRSGYEGLPIIGLLSFMIGVVIAYQMGLQLKNYGANVYIVDLLGLSILREFGPLITAIIVAGRTGSAFTAQLGIMKMNQEIDALNTMGVTPAELLLIPRVLGLFIVLPLLTMWANVFGVIGGMVLSNSMLNITWYDFLQRFPNVIPLRALLIGIGKAPIFALLIASIGCFQGMQVTGSAESVGKNTTRSVVLAIFSIIVADAFFSILFSKLKL